MTNNNSPTPFKKISLFLLNALSVFRDWIHDVLPYFIVLILFFSICFIYFWPQVVITINSGEAGVLYKRFFGTVTDEVYPEGVHVIYPWDTLYIYNVRIQTVLHDFEILSNKGLPIHISVAIRFNPEYEMLGMLHQKVGPDYINTIVVPQVESVLRKRLSFYDPEDIYVNKDNILTKVIVEASDELGKKYIIPNSIVIRSIALPNAIREAIENKLIQQQLEKSYTYILEKEKKEAERKRIEAQGIKDYQSIVMQTLSDILIKWQGVQATLELAKSNNTKVVIIGAGKEGLPVILGNDNNVMPSPPSTESPEKNPSNSALPPIVQNSKKNSDTLSSTPKP
jgi:regulator of protease activity HflC (stomatin/prohibitin superfamily)